MRLNEIKAFRQPMESLFNWLIEKTGIENVSKTRSVEGLIVHMFAKTCRRLDDVFRLKCQRCECFRAALKKGSLRTQIHKALQNF